MRESTIDPTVVRQATANLSIGHSIVYRVSVPSTMPVAHELANADHAASGTVVVTEEQTLGRGRYDRRWSAPAGTALLTSVLLKPPHLPDPPGQAAMLAGLAICRAVETVAPVLVGRVVLKWPNDVLITDPASDPGAQPSTWGKIAGILIEGRFMGPTLAYTVLGMGINVNQQLRDLPAVLPGALAPVSIRSVTGQTVDRNALLIELCRALDSLLAPTVDLFAHWRARLSTLGQMVTIQPQLEAAADQWHGQAVDVDRQGNLILQLADGTQRTVAAGDVSIRPAVGHTVKQDAFPRK